MILQDYRGLYVHNTHLSATFGEERFADKVKHPTFPEQLVQAPSAIANIKENV